MCVCLRACVCVGGGGEGGSRISPSSVCCLMSSDVS